jgi:hypothetical protein
MRRLTVRGDDDAHPTSPGRNATHESTGAERFIVGVGGNHDELVRWGFQQRR